MAAPERPTKRRGRPGLRRAASRPISGAGAPGQQGADLAWQAGAVLRVGTFNVCGGKGLDGNRDQARAAKLLDAADLVGLQEVHGARHLEKLAVRLNRHSIYFPAETRWFREYRGNGLLTRLAVGEWQVEPLPNSRHKGFRSLAAVRVGSGPAAFTCFVSHCSKHEDRDRHLEAYFSSLAEHPRAVLMADLNTRRDHPLLERLLAENEVVDAIGRTLGAEDPPGRIDWILTRGFEVLGGGTVGRGVSDHPYYWVDLR